MGPAEISEHLREIRASTERMEIKLAETCVRMKEHDRRLDDHDNINKGLGIGLVLAFVAAIFNYLFKH